MRRTFRLLREIARVVIEEDDQDEAAGKAVEHFVGAGLLPENAEALAYHYAGDWNAPGSSTYVVEEVDQHINKLLSEGKGVVA